MGNLSLQNAFAIFGAKPANRFNSVSAIAANGAEMILSCSAKRFRHPARGILRYEDTLSREPESTAQTQSLSQHLMQAREANLPIRMIVITERQDATGEVTRDIHVRVDLVGKVIEFDGERFVVDFVRNTEPANDSARRRKSL
jgi:hypothetical protein